MKRLPRLLDPRFVPALALTILAAVYCGGRVDSSGGTAQRSASSSSSSSPNGPDASVADSATGTTNADSATGTTNDGLTCANPIHVSVGETFSGSTCGGSPPWTKMYCTDSGTVAYFYVDAPSGTDLRIDSTSAVHLVGYTDCTHAAVCSGPTSLLEPGVQLFSVQVMDTSYMSHTCGDFTLTVTRVIPARD